MFLRQKIRRKDGKEHRTFSVVENKRVAGGRVVQRHVLYLGEINDSQELAWRKSIEVLEEGSARLRTLSLFLEDRCEGLVADTSIVHLRLSQMRLTRPRQWGACWLALTLWRELQLDRFWAERLPASRKSLPPRRRGARAGTMCCWCWWRIGCWRRAASGVCIATGSRRARWPTCFVMTWRLPRSTRSMPVTTCSLPTSRRCSIIWWGAGAICSTSPSMCCCTI